MQHIHQYRSDHAISFEDVDSTVRSIAHDVIRTIIQNSETNDRKVISKELRKHREFSTIQSFVTNSVSVKLRRFLSTRYSSETEKKIFVTTLERSVSLVVLFMSFLPAVEYYLEGSLLLAYYDAWQTYAGVKKGFTLAPYFQGLFYANLSVMLISYVFSVILCFVLLPAHKGNNKVLFYLARLICPLYLPILRAIHKIKLVFSKDPTFELYQENILMDKEYGKIRLMLLIPKTCLENIPQLIFALFLFMSDPLKESVIKDDSSPFKSVEELALINLTKSFISLVLVSNTFTAFLNIIKDFSLSVSGSIAISLSNLAFIISRVCGILFCLIFSTCYPDLQFYLFYLAQSRTFTLRSVITPDAIEEIYQTTISPTPAFFVLVFLSVLIIGYYLVFYLFIQPKLVKALTTPELVMSSILNIACPFVPNVTFQGSYARRNRIKINVFTYAVGFLVNAMLVTFPLILYGQQFFKTTLPVLDELCRFYSFIRSTDFPSTFPHFLPAHVLSGHILFPTTALSAYLLAILLHLLYRFAFHPQKAIPTNAIQALTPGFDLGRNVFINGQFLVDFPSES